MSRIPVLMTMALALSAAASAQEPALPRIEGGLTLEEAVRIGLRQSYMLDQARAEVDAAAARTRRARAMAGPQVSANGFASTGNQESMFMSPPEIMPAAATMMMSGPVIAPNLTLMLPLFTGGRLGAMVRQAALERQAEESELAEARASVALEIREAYLDALRMLAMAEAEEARVIAAQAMVGVTRDMFAAGEGIEASVKRSESELAEAQRDALTARNEYEKALLMLKSEMAVDLASPVTLTDRPAFLQPTLNLETLLTQAERHRPLVRAAQARVESVQAMVSAAKGSQAPQVYGMARGDWMSSREERSRSGYTLGIAVGIPLLDGGQRRAEIDEARAMEREARAMLADTKLRVQLEVRQALLDLQTAAENYRSAAAAVTAAEAAYEVVRLRTESGKGILVEELDALAALTEARSDLAEAQFQHRLALARLERAVGTNIGQEAER